jgi:hypothetical protein
MSSHRLSRIVGVLGALMLALVAVTSAQTPQGAAPSGMAELLAEVRGLRADLNQVAGASMRMQVLVARLSLQEQRINTLGRQLADTQAQLDAVTRQRVADENNFNRVDSFLSSNDPSLSAGDRRGFETERSQAKALLSQAQAQEQQLRGSVTDFSNLIATEQSRWTDFNNRLDALEQSLPSGTTR